jgi:hypothetical protein
MGAARPADQLDTFRSAQQFREKCAHFHARTFL